MNYPLKSGIMTNNAMAKDVDKFLNNLDQCLSYNDSDNTSMYLYGSSIRKDYVSGKSDIDIAIFTDNELNTVNRLQHFLKTGNNAFKKIVWNLNGEVIYGYKIKEAKGIYEISVYNNCFKKNVVKELRRGLHLSYFIYFLLYILKIVYYRLHLLDENTYTKIKRYILNDLSGNVSSIFVIF